MKLRWKKHCILAAGGVENVDANSNNIIFTIKDAKLYVPVMAPSAKDKQKLSKRLSERSVRSVKIKRENKNATYVWKYFLESNFVGVCFDLFWIETNNLFILKNLFIERYYQEL